MSEQEINDLPGDTEQSRLQKAYQKKKKKLPMNLLEFLVGGILLLFCFSYLAQHPAEKSSIVSGLEVIFQKTKIFLSQFTTGQGALLEQKYEMERAFQELIYIGEDGTCFTESDLRKLYSYRDNLDAMSAEEFSRHQGTYESLLEGYFRQVKARCDDGTINDAATGADSTTGDA